MTQDRDITPQGASDGADTAADSIWSRAYGVALTPRRTFARIADRPTWLGMLAGVTLVMTISTWAFFRTEIGRQAYIDQQVVTRESFGIEVTDEAYERLQRNVSANLRWRLLGLGVGLSFASIALAALLHVLFARFGRQASFHQVLAIVAHANVIMAVRQIVVTPLYYARESISSSVSLATLLPLFAAGSFPARLLGAIDVFFLWWLATLAAGLGVLYRQPAGGIRAVLLGIYAIFAAGIAAVVMTLSIA